MLTTLEKAKALKEFNGLRVALVGGALKTLEKAKSLKRFNELRVLLGGGSAKPDTSKYDGYIKIAADSLAELRLVDVERVLSESGLRGDELTAFGDYIINGRSDLADEVNSLVGELWSPKPAKYESPKELFLKEANAKRQDIEESGFSGAVKKISAIIEDVASNIGTIEEAKKRLESAIWETKNPLQSGEWRSVQSGQKFYFEDMQYGEVVDTRKEGRSHSSDPWRTSDGKYFTGLRDAKAHELESYSKQRLINDGFMDGVKTEIKQYKPPKDYTQLLDGIALGDINVFEDNAKLTELVEAAKESGGDDMPGENKGLFMEAIKAAGIQMLEGKGFGPVN